MMKYVVGACGLGVVIGLVLAFSRDQPATHATCRDTSVQLRNLFAAAHVGRAIHPGVVDELGEQCERQGWSTEMRACLSSMTSLDDNTCTTTVGRRKLLELVDEMEASLSLAACFDYYRQVVDAVPPCPTLDDTSKANLLASARTGLRMWVHNWGLTPSSSIEAVNQGCVSLNRFVCPPR